jgi:hypothetical protein
VAREDVVLPDGPLDRLGAPHGRVLAPPGAAARRLAIEVHRPDAGVRRRLFVLYGHGLVLRVSDLDGLVEPTEGVSPAFVRELPRLVLQRGS